MISPATMIGCIVGMTTLTLLCAGLALVGLIPAWWFVLICAPVAVAIATDLAG